MHRRRSLLSSSIALSLALASTAASAQSTAPDPGAWPMLSHDPQRTGFAPGTGRLDATRSIRWTYYVGGNVGARQTMVADVNGDGADEVIAIVGGKLVARDLQNRVVWDSPPVGLTEIVGAADLAGAGFPVIVAVRSGPPAGVFVLDSRNGALLWSRDDFNDPAQVVNRGQALSSLNARIVQLNYGPTGAPTGRPSIVMRVSGGEALVHAFSFDGEYTSPTDEWNFPVGTTPGTHWFPHIGLGDFDGDGRIDLATQQIGVPTILYSGSRDAMRLGTQLANGMHAGAPVLDSFIATASFRLPGSPNDAFFFANVGSFGVLDTRNTERSWAVTFPVRGAGGVPVANSDVRNVSVPVNPFVTSAGLPGYLVVNVFDSHDCEVRSFPASTCSDLDGVNDAAGVKRWHMVLFDASNGRMLVDIPDRVALATVDLNGDGRPDIVSQSAGNDFTVRTVTSVAAYRIEYESSPVERTSLVRMWEVPNAGLAGTVTREVQTVSPTANVPLLIGAGTSRQLLLYQGDPSSTAVGMPSGFVFVDAVTGDPRARRDFPGRIQGRPVGLVRSTPGLSAPDSIVVSESDGTFKVFNLMFGPPMSTIGNGGALTSGGFIASIAAAQLSGSNPRRMDLVTTGSDGSLSIVPSDDATLTRAPVATARYFGGAAQYPLVVRGEDRQLRVIVANRLGTLPYFAAINALGPTELWRSDPIEVPALGRFNNNAPGVGDVNGDGTADIVVAYDGLLSNGQLSCCGSSFWNVVSGRSASAGTNHPLLWTAPFTPETAGQGTCCWAVAGATSDIDGDMRDDVAIAMNDTLAVRTGNGSVAADQQLLFLGDNAEVRQIGGSLVRRVTYGWPALANFDPTVPRSILSGIGFFGGQGVAMHAVTAGMPPIARTPGLASWSHPEFSEGTLVGTGAAASYASPAAHAATSPVGFGFGSSNGVFYALEPAARMTGMANIPLKWARCLRNGTSTMVTGARPEECTGGALSNAAAADIDGDSRDEFIVGSNDGYLYVLAAETGAVDFAYNFQTAVGAPIVADVDGDGTLGLMVPTGDGFVTALSASSPDPVIAMPRIVAVREDVATVSAPTPDVAVTTSESARYIAAAWNDPSPMRNTEYRARVLTSNGSQVLPWTSVMRTAGTSPVVWIADGTFTVGLRYLVEISAQTPGGTQADLVSTPTVLIVDSTPPEVNELTVATVRSPQRVDVRAVARDGTGLRSYTLRIEDPAGTETYRTTAPITGTLAVLTPSWTPAMPVDTSGTWTVYVEARDVANRTGMAMTTFRWDGVAPGGDGGAEGGVDAAAEAGVDAEVTEGGADVAVSDVGGGADVQSDVAAMADARGDAVSDARGGDAGTGASAGGCGCRTVPVAPTRVPWAGAFAGVAAVVGVAVRRRKRVG